MQVMVTFRHLDPTDGLRQYAEHKVQRVRKFLRRPIDAHVTLSVEKQRHVAEVQVTANRLTATATEQTGDLYSAIDLAVAKVERQIKRHVTRKQKRKTAPAPPVRVSRRARPVSAPLQVERVAAKPMSLDQAVAELELSRRAVLLFTNAERDTLAVLYRRDDGGYGVIEPEPS
jgi:putative sigma-54 modulation protein